MFTVLLVVHGILSLCLIGLVLLQQGKGADLGATIGGGGSSSVFGGSGAVDFIAKLTTGLAITFMCTSILLVRAYAYRAPSAHGTKANDFLKGSLFDKSDDPAAAAAKSEAVIPEGGVIKSESPNVVTQEELKPETLEAPVVVSPQIEDKGVTESVVVMPEIDESPGKNPEVIDPGVGEVH